MRYKVIEICGTPQINNQYCQGKFDNIENAKRFAKDFNENYRSFPNSVVVIEDTKMHLDINY